jgi:hypothetical protein
VSIQSGTHRFGPDNATLSVLTHRAGAAAKAGHDLVLRVTSWEATLVVGDDPSMELRANATSLRVMEGTGGFQALAEDDIANIHQTIDEEVLVGRDIEFRSSRVEVDDGRIRAEGELTLVGETRPLTVDLVVGDSGELSGTAQVKQSDWGMKPYSALFGALKVKDEVVVVVEGQL